MGRKTFAACALILAVLAFGTGRVSGADKAPPWVSDLPLPQNEKMLLVVKGIFPTQNEAEALRKFIQQLMVRYPGDRVDKSDVYQGLPPGKWVVGTLFDGRDRAQWWMEYSYRNRKIAKGQIKEVVLTGTSRLPYMPDATRGSQKRLLTEAEAVDRVRELGDVKKLSAQRKLKYKVTDYPKNGDLRYEVEILEDRGRKDPVMVDFVMVSALNGAITERFGESLGKPNFAHD